MTTDSSIDQRADDAAYWRRQLRAAEAERAIAEAEVARLEAVRDACIAADPLITVGGETKMPRECWLAIEAAILASGVHAPVVGIVPPDDLCALAEGDTP